MHSECISGPMREVNWGTGAGNCPAHVSILLHPVYTCFSLQAYELAFLYFKNSEQGTEAMSGIVYSQAQEMLCLNSGVVL